MNPNWILYNYLAELTPMPNSWDVTAPGKTVHLCDRRLRRGVNRHGVQGRREVPGRPGGHA